MLCCLKRCLFDKEEVLFFRCKEKTIWLLYLILGSLHFSHFAMKCTGFFPFPFSKFIHTNGNVAEVTWCYCFLVNRFFPLTHIQLSNPGNSRHQLGRMLAVDSRQAAFINRIFLLCSCSLSSELCLLTWDNLSCLSTRGGYVIEFQLFNSSATYIASGLVKLLGMWKEQHWILCYLTLYELHLLNSIILKDTNNLY